MLLSPKLILVVSIVSLPLLGVSQNANGPELGKKRLDKYSESIKNILILDKKYSNSSITKKKLALKEFSNIMEAISLLPRDTSRDMAGELFSKLKNTDFIKTAIGHPRISLFFASEIVEYSESLGDSKIERVKRQTLFERELPILSSKVNGSYRMTPLKELKRRALGARDLRERIKLLKGRTLLERIVLRYIKTYRESPPFREGQELYSRIKKEGRVIDHLEEYVIFVSNRRLSRSSKGILRISYFVRRKYSKKDEVVIWAVVSSEKNDHYFRTNVNRMDASSLEGLEKNVQDFKNMWSSLGHDRFMRIYDYIVSVGLLKGKTVSYSDFDDSHQKIGWLGESRNSYLIHKSIMNARTYEEIFVWRRIFQSLMADDVLYSIDDIPDEQAKESDEHVIGKHTASRIRIFNQVMARQGKQLSPTKIFSELQKKIPPK